MWCLWALLQVLGRLGLDDGSQRPDWHTHLSLYSMGRKTNLSPSNMSVWLPSGTPHVPAGTPHGKCHVYHHAEEKHMSGPDTRVKQQKWQICDGMNCDIFLFTFREQIRGLFATCCETDHCINWLNFWLTAISYTSVWFLRFLFFPTYRHLSINTVLFQSNLHISVESISHLNSDETQLHKSPLLSFN